MFHTRICDLFQIQYPIIKGAMAWISNNQLVSAVSEAGGLGVLAGGFMSPEQLEEEIIKTKESTDKPFAVNLFLKRPDIEDMVKVVIKQKIKLIFTGAGDPVPLIPILHRYKMKVIPVVPNVRLAKKVEDKGADAVVVEGTEAGGHIAYTSTMNFVPQTKDALEKIPLIAAGGIADGRGMVAALALGADGVQLGTRFVATEESPAHPNYKQAILDASDSCSCITGLTIGYPVRCLKNKLTEKYLEMEKKGAFPEELDKLGQGKLELAVVEGDVENGSVMSGQSAGTIKDIKTCQEVIDSLLKEGKKVIEDLNGFIS